MSGAAPAFLAHVLDLALVGAGDERAAVDSRLDASTSSLPDEIQYMPPGRHRIHAHQGGEGVILDVDVTAETAAALEQSLQAALVEVTAGRGDRPYFDFNHEDREASGWPGAFRWAGDDPVSGGVRVRVDWSDAGRSAIAGRTFRRFSPSFFVQGVRVTGAPVNMGGLVNRAAFRSIQPLFARGAPALSTEPMNSLISELKKLGVVQDAADDATAAREACAVIAKLRTDLDTATKRVADLERERTESIRARAKAHVDAAARAGRIPAADTKAREFWLSALTTDEAGALHILGNLSAYSVLAPVVPADDGKSRPRDLMAAQQSKLADVRAANPDADFATLFAKAQTESPDLFR